MMSKIKLYDQLEGKKKLAMHQDKSNIFGLNSKLDKLDYLLMHAELDIHVVSFSFSNKGLIRSMPAEEWKTVR